jgi:hypothetical protein
MPRKGVALVTGSGRGLGAAIAKRLGEAGWPIWYCARTENEVMLRVSEARKNGTEAWGAVVDVSDPESVEGLFAQIQAKGHFVEVCVNNAGGNYSHRLVSRAGTPDAKEHPIVDWAKTIDVCLTGTFLVGRSAAKEMANFRRGVIVNISSCVSEGAIGQSAYTAAKAGVNSLTTTWAHELGEFGVRVASVAPGVIDGHALKKRSDASLKHAQYMSKLLLHTPLQKWCTEEDVSSAVLFVVENQSVTNTTIEVDCGKFPAKVL